MDFKEPTESRSLPISAGGYFYNHSDEQDRADFADFTSDELVELEEEQGFDFSEHPAMKRD